MKSDMQLFLFMLIATYQHLWHAKRAWKHVNIIRAWKHVNIIRHSTVSFICKIFNKYKGFYNLAVKSLYHDIQMNKDTVPVK